MSEMVDEVFMDASTIDNERSEIKDFFEGTSVFITGATGFLGKLILEKLLRTCDGIRKIYVLIREKKGKTTEDRYKELFDAPIFDGLRRDRPNFADKVIMMAGDCVQPKLGLSEQNQHLLLNEVNCIFHCAATVRFDEKLRICTYINVRATKDLLLLAKDMESLKSFVYVSTAYSFCVRKEIEEVFYDPIITGDKLIELVDVLNDETLEKVSPILLEKFPNTYVFSKAVTENIVKIYGRGLPVSVVRPSIVIATVKEPVAGWMDNIYGATGVFVGAALGLIRTLHCDKNAMADMVPADYVINCTIASAWDVNKTRQFEGADEDSEPIVYNYIMSNHTPITWSKINNMLHESLVEIPTQLQVWYTCFIMNSNYWMHYLCLILMHRIPAYIVDFIARCLGKKPLMVKGYKKIEKFMDVISYFSTKEWKFEDYHTQNLWKKLNDEDKRLFEFNLDGFDWTSYVHTYGRGGRVYLLKDPMDTVPQGRIKYRRLKIAHYTLITILLLGILYLLKILWNAIF